MKKHFKILSIALIFVILVSTFVGCSKKSSQQTDGKYTYWVTMPAAASKTLNSYNDSMMYQEISKATGVDVEFIHPSTAATGTEAFQVLMASGNYPDMIEYNWYAYAGGPDQAIKDGVIIALNDYMKEFAPNYYDYMEGEKGREAGGEFKAQSLTSNGNYFGFGNLQIGNAKGFSGLYVRKDLLDKWGLDIPVTIDDWDEIFATAKKNGIKYPLTGKNDLVGPFSVRGVIGAWHVGGDYYLDGGKVKFGPFEEGFKDYVIKMTEWFKKGYIDMDYITNDANAIDAAITRGTSIASYGWIGGDLGKLIPAMKERNSEFNIVACPFPVLKEGDKPWFQEYGGSVISPYIAISKQCGKDDETRYKEAMKWCDYVYGEEGMILKTFGVKGDTYTVEKDENGETHYVYTDKVTKPDESKGFYSIQDVLYHYFRPSNAPGLSQHPDYLNGFYQYEQQKDAIKVWNKYVDESKLHSMPPLVFTNEEAAKKAEIEAKGKDKLIAAVSDIMLGKAPIDTLDSAIKEAKDDGFEELRKIHQAAYDRYIKLLNK